MPKRFIFAVLKRFSRFLDAGIRRRKIKEYFQKKFDLRLNRVFPGEPDLEDRFQKYLGEPRFERRHSRKKQVFDLKPVAFYLPQFHAIPENDKWWGKGFTEWTNARKAQPQFSGHYQPREPHPDIGYYDLSQKIAIKRQIEIAQAHGIYGFCYYFYWFAGKRLLETPLDILLKNKDLKHPFCICWANENWTRRWDGEEREILMAQDYKADNDIKLAEAMLPYIRDRRYIRVQGKPLILMYRPSLLPDPKKSQAAWRAFFKDAGVGEVLLANVHSCGDFSPPERYGFDLSVEFPPMFDFDSYGLGSKARNLAADFQGLIHSYPAILKRLFSLDSYWQKRKYLLLRGAMLAWDNTARRHRNAWIYNGYHPKLFETWLGYVTHYTQRELQRNDGLFFINAWNEWAEGTYLEPDKRYGYSALNTVLRVLRRRENEHLEITKKPVKLAPIKIAVHLHLFYTDLLGEMISYLKNIPVSFALFVTVIDESQVGDVRKYCAENLSRAGLLQIAVVPNRGRDLSHLFAAFTKELLAYEFILHIHTKKSLYSPEMGNRWRRHLLQCTLGSETLVKNILRAFQLQEKIGIIYPEIFSEIRGNVEWGGNLPRVQQLLSRIGINELAVFGQELAFPAGSFFWLRTKAFSNLFASSLHYDDFETEKGQINGTLAHALERSFVLIARENGFEERIVKNF